MRATHIPDLPAIHAEELSFLLGQRQARMHDPLTVVREITELEQRITAHAEAIWLHPAAALGALAPRLTSDDADDMFAATWTLWNSDNPQAQKMVLDHLSATSVGNRAPMIQALCLSNSKTPLPVLDGDESDFGHIFQCAEFAACKKAMQHTRIGAYLKHADAPVRFEAWRLACYNFEPISIEQCLAGAIDNDPQVAEAAMNAVAWKGQSWLLEHCRRAANNPGPAKLAELRMLAILGIPEDKPLIAALVENKTLGSARFSIMASYGQTNFASNYIKGMADTDVATAIASGDTFTRITGCTVKISQRKQIPFSNSEEKNTEETNFEEFNVPSPEDAARQWDEIKDRFTPGRRYSGGVDITETPADWGEVDMQSRWEHHLRNAFYGRPHLTPVELEQFPLRLNPDPATAAPADENDPRQPPRPRSYLLKQWPRNRTAE
jgi:uncharacterized protein (TIGR02270 family)